MNVVQEIRRINEQELKQGLTGKASWHHEYKDSAWVFAGGFAYDLSEGDVLCVMSQWGEIEDINLCREQDTGKSKGFCFIKYEDQRSTILAVDNFNGIQLLGRTIRVDHKHKYSLPKEVREREEKLEEERVARGEAPKGAGAQWRPGVAYEGKKLANDHNFHKGVDVFAAPDKGAASSDDSDVDGGGFLEGETAEERRIRKEVKKARKEARRGKREQKAQKKLKEGDKKKHKKHKKVKNGANGSDEQQRGSKANGATGGDYDDSRNGYGQRGWGIANTDMYNDRNRDGGSRADAAGVWERGARAPATAGDGRSSASFASSRVEAPAPLSTGNVMDWRGLGGQGGGRGGRRGGGGGRVGTGRGGRDGGRGGGGGRDSGRGGGGGTNSFGGMNRRR